MAEENALENSSDEGKQGFTCPTAYTVLFVLLILVVIATWFVPASMRGTICRGEAESDTPNATTENC